jgi:GNAT superfamily N-acetyltransferase
VKQNAPLFGLASEAGALIGAATMTPPNEPPMHDEIGVRADATWSALGDAARDRYHAYADAAKTVLIDRPHHHLNMIGIVHAEQGRGHARVLLDAVAELARQDRTSTGITLTTELPKNVAIYEHAGYRVHGHVRVAPGLETWGMWREAPASV